MVPAHTAVPGQGCVSLGPKLCAPCLSTPDLNFVLLSPKQILLQMPRPAFSPVFRGTEKPSRLSEWPPNHSLQTRDTSLRASSRVKLGLSPHPLQPIPAESCVSSTLCAHPAGALHRDCCSSSTAHLQCAAAHNVKDEEGEDECKAGSSPRTQVNWLRHLMHPLSPAECVLLHSPLL